MTRPAKEWERVIAGRWGEGRLHNRNHSRCSTAHQVVSWTSSRAWNRLHLWHHSDKNITKLHLSFVKRIDSIISRLLFFMSDCNISFKLPVDTMHVELKIQCFRSYRNQWRVNLLSLPQCNKGVGLLHSIFVIISNAGVEMRYSEVTSTLRIH